MNHDDRNFDQLCRLLKLMRYEKPPPYYFQDFSSEVIARIKLGERGDPKAPLLARVLSRASWLPRFWEALDAKPAVIGAFSLATCALLVGGVIHSLGSAVNPMALKPDTASSGRNAERIAVAIVGNRPLLALPATYESSSMDPIPAAPLTVPWQHPGNVPPR